MTEETNKEVLKQRRYSRYRTQVEPIMSDPLLRGYFTLVASFLLVAFFILFALSPTFSTIVGLLRKIDDQKEVLSALESKITNLITAQENYSQIEPKLFLLDEAMPEKPNPQKVFDDLISSASSSGVTINSLQIDAIYLSGINPQSIQTTGLDAPAQSGFLAKVGAPIVSFRISIDGSEEEIRKYLGTIVKLPRVIDLTNVAISNRDESSEEVLESEIAGSAFYYPSALPVVKPEEPEGGTQ